MKNQWVWIGIVITGLAGLMVVERYRPAQIGDAQALHLQSTPLAAAFVELQAEFILSQLAQQPSSNQDLCDRARSASDRLEQSLSDDQMNPSNPSQHQLKALQRRLDWLKNQCTSLTDSDIPSIQELKILARQLRTQLSQLPSKSATLHVASAVASAPIGGAGLN